VGFWGRRCVGQLEMEPVGQVSPDGAWRWNGAAWVATDASAPAGLAASGLLRKVPGFRTNVPWKMAVAGFAYLGMAGLALITLVALIVASTGIAQPDSNNSGRPVAQVAPSMASPSPSQTFTVSPTASPIPSSSPKPKASPRASPSPSPHPKPVPLPSPKPAPPKSTCGAPANPLGYNFCGGKFIYSPAATICNYFKCIPSFWTSVKGYVDECRDGFYSHSGGRQGACSYHGGELRPLYSR